jgi:hypothetical protein
VYTKQQLLDEFGINAELFKYLKKIGVLPRANGLGRYATYPADTYPRLREYRHKIQDREYGRDLGERFSGSPS